MRVVFGCSWVALAAALLLVFARPAAAQPDRVARLVVLLRTNGDFRVRTQAALALGASQDQRAVGPLCSGLADVSRTVRAAAAAALGKLEKGGTQCLERRLAIETSQSVRASIERVLERLGGGPRPTIGPDTKYYLAIGKVTDTPNRPPGDVDRRIRGSMTKAAAALKVYAVAPPGETVTQAEALLAPHSELKAFYLAPRLEFVYGGGSLTVRISVAMFSYPERALIGEYSFRVAQPGVTEPDRGAEDELVEAAGEPLMQMFNKHVARL
jgi:hypothetical protein